MTTAEERLEVLKMIQSGHITADEGARLLEALRERETERPPEEPGPASRGKGTRLFRIRVTDLRTGQQKVDLRMPWSLINVGLDMGARLGRQEIKVEEFAEAIQAGAEGKIMDMVDEEDGERVEVFVE